ncbi:uncharacterized protein B0I36DRAFT_147125 [Microdochium trichocladiopsis]|uniref:Uncharacterized protein n=1 Tax=Microdochium trichocladiopsis TaxID=1682393 RepID=A0A9P9BLH9_9PEZI|nr:uncharacterized protein B0I36DRAFT_147125 [Microdochium trichocladiopsis]KAH7028102.1 hypothetical protein B0I36DRAFT_147125 [Microdochium trichocladiopsis]
MPIATYLHSAQALLAAWGGFQSAIAITRLQTYESASEKLAEWSSEAARQLHKTRTTQASGALGFLFSFAASVFLATSDPTDRNSVLASPFLRYNAAPTMVIALLLARTHMRNYWAPRGDGKKVGWKPPIKMMEDYNEAQRRTENIMVILEACAYSWMVAAVIVFFGW